MLLNWLLVLPCQRLITFSLSLNPIKRCLTHLLDGLYLITSLHWNPPFCSIEFLISTTSLQQRLSLVATNRLLVNSSDSLAAACDDFCREMNCGVRCWVGIGEEDYTQSCDPLNHAAQNSCYRSRRGVKLCNYHSNDSVSTATSCR